MYRAQNEIPYELSDSQIMLYSYDIRNKKTVANTTLRSQYNQIRSNDLFSVT